MLAILAMILRGLAIGFMISAPMGPVGILCIQRTLNKGRRTGFHTGIGAAISDMIYCFLTGFGLSFIEDFLEAHRNPIQLAGSLLLVGYGIYLFKKNPSRALHSPTTEQGSPKKDILGGFLFTFSNPLILFLIIGLFARFNFGDPDCLYYHYIVGYCAILVGALTWWWVVTYFVDKVRSHFNLRSMWLINKIIGCVMLLFGIVGIGTALYAMYPMKAAAAVHRASPLYEFVQQQDSTATPIIANTSGDTLYRTIPHDIGNDDFQWVANAKDLHAALNKQYTYTDNHGNHKASPPGWGVVVEDPPNNAFLHAIIYPQEAYISQYSDETKPTLTLSVTWKTPDDETTHSETLQITDKELQPDNTPISISITRHDNDWSVMAGHSSLIQLWSKSLSPITISRIGLVAPPASEFRLNRTSLHQYPHEDLALHTPWIENIEALNERLRHSSDPTEGLYTYFDYEFDDTLLRLGGEYRIALLSDDTNTYTTATSHRKSYTIYYISGANVNPGKWIAGMVKGHLTPNAGDNGYNLTWYDADCLPLTFDLTATITDNHLLTLYFPYQQSTLRFRKTPQ
jgi:threonine/homoserine/homoserine lactone efflux protein